MSRPYWFKWVLDDAQDLTVLEVYELRGDAIIGKALYMESSPATQHRVTLVAESGYAHIPNLITAAWGYFLKEDWTDKVLYIEG